MGTLLYDAQAIEFDDRLLTHLQIVIVNKFRHGESFVISWLDDLSIGNGRSAMWMTPTHPAFFKFSGSRVPSINAEWLKALETSANSSRGLVVVDEKGELAHAGRSYGPPVNNGRSPQ